MRNEADSDVSDIHLRPYRWVILTSIILACRQSDFYVILGCSDLFIECQFPRQSDSVSCKTSIWSKGSCSGNRNFIEAAILVHKSSFKCSSKPAVFTVGPLSSVNGLMAQLGSQKCSISCSEITRARKETCHYQFLYQPVLDESLCYLNQAVLDEAIAQGS